MVRAESPLIDPLGRLPKLLRDYRQDEVWLEITRLHCFRAQEDQAVCTVRDGAGMILRHPRRCIASHTFRLNPAYGAVAVGDRFHVHWNQTQGRVEVGHVVPAYA